MDLALGLKGYAIGLFISLPITPIGILCLKRMLARGPLIGFISGCGSATADFIYSILAALSIAYITLQLQEHPIAIQLISGIVLCTLGVYILKTPPKNISSDLAKGTDYWHAYLSACMLTLSNPATIITFAGMFAAIGLAPHYATSNTALTIATGVFLGAMTWWLLSSTILSVLKPKISSRSLEKINTICGILIISFGIIALVSLARNLF